MSPSATGIGQQYCLHYSTTALGNAADSNLTTLASFTVGAGVLLRNGDSILFEFYGTFSSTDASDVLVNFGGQPICDPGSLTPTGGGFMFSGRITRAGAGAQVAYGFYLNNTEAVFVSPAAPLTLNEATPLTLEIVASAVDADQVICTGCYVSFIQGPS